MSLIDKWEKCWDIQSYLDSHFPDWRSYPKVDEIIKQFVKEVIAKELLKAIDKKIKNAEKRVKTIGKKMVSPETEVRRIYLYQMHNYYLGKETALKDLKKEIFGSPNPESLPRKNIGDDRGWKTCGEKPSSEEEGYTNDTKGKRHSGMTPTERRHYVGDSLPSEKQSSEKGE